SLAMSAHKIGAVAGIGALLLRDDRALAPIIAGGGQERGRRGGTQPVALAAAFAAGLDAPYDAARIATLRDRAERGAIEAGAIVCG
ncbi:aminotransferase class V-fold PLP-dependent enzyme, partial [Enterococcus faecium]|uniref:aminotransferase class V-fold PLP-dependent enzyme n=1 Tax=Enterococcus faecium TaxID=1352 RepID=UPI003F4249BB